MVCRPLVSPLIRYEKNLVRRAQLTVEKKPRAARLFVPYDWFSPAGLIIPPLCVPYKDRDASFWHSYVVMHKVVCSGRLGKN
jgi:hypothetical protein